MSNRIDEETVPPCVICGKVWKRKDAKYWVYHRSVGVVCLSHRWVSKWYANLIKKEKNYGNA